jgi:hypothetical protein
MIVPLPHTHYSSLWHWSPPTSWSVNQTPPVGDTNYVLAPEIVEWLTDKGEYHLMLAEPDENAPVDWQAGYEPFTVAIYFEELLTASKFCETWITSGRRPVWPSTDFKIDFLTGRA